VSHHSVSMGKPLAPWSCPWQHSTPVMDMQVHLAAQGILWHSLPHEETHSELRLLMGTSLTCGSQPVRSCCEDACMTELLHVQYVAVKGNNCTPATLPSPCRSGMRAPGRPTSAMARASCCLLMACCSEAPGRRMSGCSLLLSRLCAG